MADRHQSFGGAMTGVLIVAFAAVAATQARAGGPVASTTSGQVVGTREATTADGTVAVAPLYRNINPFYRNIRAFWGDVNPFYRNIRAFWGDVAPFYRNIRAFEGDISPFYRNIRAFWGDLNPLYRNIRAFGTSPLGVDYAGLGDGWEAAGSRWTEIDQAWAAAGSDPVKLAAVRDQLLAFEEHAAGFWGSAVTGTTGQSFNAGFASGVWQRFGIDLTDPATLAALPENERGHLMMDWYDGLMDFSGVDHPDHWMGTANWTPHVTQIQGSAASTVIGLVDMFVAGDADIKSKVVWQGGGSWSNGHGAAVASLIASSHDGKGLMGIAPNARIAAFNPFDETGSADWASVRAGVISVRGQSRPANDRATVINLSLGVPGWALHPDWNKQVFSNSTVKSWKDQAVYVLAAGNDGVTQTQNVEWKDSLQTNFILVGSLNPGGTISEFSNRPGNVCLLDNGACKNSLKLDESGLLMHRFITAPGELILVSDDKGGHTRLSGTSFAAPLVSGAIALLHDRWPWLKQKPQDTVHIILKSARDLGDPGVDPVYGVGMLDVTASQSPLDYNKLFYYLYSGTNKLQEVKLDQLRNDGLKSSWETDNLHMVAMEKLPNGERDFLIPLSSRLWGSTYNGEYMQDYLYSRFAAHFGGVRSFTDAPQWAMQVPMSSGWRLSMSAGAPRGAIFGEGRRSAMRMDGAMRFDAPNGRLGFTFGHGGGAVALGSQAGFALTSDLHPVDGGVNPVLGFASGGSYAGADVALTNKLSMAMGLTHRRRSLDADLASAGGVQRELLARLERYDAGAANLRVDYRPASDVKLSAAYTELDEGSGLLGIRSIERSDLSDGARTRAVTFGAEVGVGDGFQLLASATRSRTTADGDNALRVAEGGLIGSAYQVGVAKAGLFSGSDKARLSIAQPMRIEQGALLFDMVGVIDRETGEIGRLTERFDVARAERRLVGEALYSVPLLDGTGEFSAFGRGELLGDGQSADALGLVVGTNLRFGL